MLCYNDKTYCTFYLKCARGFGCSRAYDKSAIIGAHKWWGGPGAPVAFFGEKPDCFEKKKT